MIYDWPVRTLRNSRIALFIEINYFIKKSNILPNFRGYFYMCFWRSNSHIWVFKQWLTNSGYDLLLGLNIISVYNDIKLRSAKHRLKSKTIYSGYSCSFEIHLWHDLPDKIQISVKLGAFGTVSRVIADVLGVQILRSYVMDDGKTVTSDDACN